VSQLREREVQGRLELPYSLVLAEITSVWDRVELENVDKTERIVGTDEVLRLIRNRGGRVGVITRGCRTYAIEALRRTQLLSFIDIIIGRDDTEETKPNPEPLLLVMSILGVGAHETIMVGDTIEDALCALRSGVPFVGVSTGLSDESAFIGMENVMVLGSVRGLFF
jgi:phosphoglycolate phosphatase